MGKTIFEIKRFYFTQLQNSKKIIVESYYYDEFDWKELKNIANTFCEPYKLKCLVKENMYINKANSLYLLLQIRYTYKKRI